MRAPAALCALALLCAAASPQLPPPPPPAWDVRAVRPDAADVPAQTYVVRPGDTLSRVVERTDAGAEAIARENRLAAPYVVRAGQRLKIPAGRYHRVRRGQSGIAIARAYGVDWSRIATLNRLEEPYILRDGQRLLLPSASEVANMTLEQRAAAFRIDIDDLVTGSEPALAKKAAPAPPLASIRRSLSPTIPVAPPEARFSGRFLWPLAGRIVRPFGPLPGGARNDGINIAARRGTPVAAAADGVVAYAGSLASFGQLVLVRHGDGWLTAYGYLDTLLVKRGQAVSRGQTIARAGTPQLHFEIRAGRRPVNPLGMLESG